MTFNRFAGLGTLHALRTLVFRSRTAWLRRFQGRERDVRDESASVCLGGAGRQCIEAVLPLATDEVRVDVRAPSRQQPALEAFTQPAHPRAPQGDRAVAQAQPPWLAEAVAVARNGIDTVAPLVPRTPEHAVHLFFQHPLQELLHALPGEGFQRLPGRA